MSSELQRAVGRIEAKLETVGDDVHDLKGQVAALVAASNVQKGQRRATVFISSGAASVVAAIVGWFVSAWDRL
jgi:hypothetical protein